MEYNTVNFPYQQRKFLKCIFYFFCNVLPCFQKESKLVNICSLNEKWLLRPDSEVCIVITVDLDCAGFESLWGKWFFFFRKCSNRLWGLPNFSFSGYYADAVTSTTHLHVGPRVRVSGAIPLILLYVFMTWKYRTFYLARSILVRRCFRFCNYLKNLAVLYSELCMRKWNW
jgi:hypothetical protein